MRAQTLRAILQLRRECLQESSAALQSEQTFESTMCHRRHTLPVGRDIRANLQAKIRIFDGTLTCQNLTQDFWSPVEFDPPGLFSSQSSRCLFIAVIMQYADRIENKPLLS